MQGAQWLSGRVLDSRPKGRGFEPHRRHCVVSLSKNNYPSLVLVQPRKTRPYITERLLMGRKESNQTKTLFSAGYQNIFSRGDIYENALLQRLLFIHDASEQIHLPSYIPGFFSLTEVRTCI